MAIPITKKSGDFVVNPIRSPSELDGEHLARGRGVFVQKFPHRAFFTLCDDGVDVPAPVSDLVHFSARHGANQNIFEAMASSLAASVCPT